MTNLFDRLTMAPNPWPYVVDAIRLNNLVRPHALCSCACGRTWEGREGAIEEAAAHVSLYRWSSHATRHVVTVEWSASCTMVARVGRRPRR